MKPKYWPHAENVFENAYMIVYLLFEDEVMYSIVIYNKCTKFSSWLHEYKMGLKIKKGQKKLYYF